MNSAAEDSTRSVQQLQDFLGDLLILGSLQGFRYFQPWLRGREELLLSVVNKDLSWKIARGARVPITSPTESHGFGLTPPGDPSPLMPLRLQKRTSGNGQGDVGLPPASPCDHEVVVPGPDCTLFLLTGYTTYQQPLVWLRSHHPHLLRSAAGDGADNDIPLRLESTAGWHRNGALTSFLQKLVIHGDWEQPYHSKVLEDLETLNRLHVKALLEMRRLRESEEEAGGEQEKGVALPCSE
ncbi:uncharacterized protein si:dkey-19b23.7 isoform X3 [Hypanus sabinus]|uniref:uncharacterized protein si:dkey-19b23.7 isoform X3 n=1 Tax=Hypanus sabinus TaxID=79690 RepID=UPI0028C48C4E|nr:uncharacterized protein si:dkey-19b23.7 isoform X3 [Hypanus sabinus]